MNEQILSMLSAASSLRIACVGDIMLDCFVNGEARRISPEAPVPVFLESSTDQMLGGAANVARNIRAYGANVDLHGIVGDDDDAATLRELAGEADLTHALVTDASRCTTTKTRFVAQGQQLLRSDRECKSWVDSTTEKQLLRGVMKPLLSSSVLVLSDYAKGCLTRSLVSDVIEKANTCGIPVVVDPKGSDISRYRGAWIITPNEGEFHVLSGNEDTDVDSMTDSARKLMDEHQIANIMITLGSRGILLVTPVQTYSFPTVAKQVFDVSGAGDSVVAALAVSLGCGLSVRQACYLANLAGGIAVEKSGTAVVLFDEIIDRLMVAEDLQLSETHV
ncbi:bifunctional heptose 7-phosphate kinase/heptose 1-phosphate adenyltransferase [Neorhodopirellula lusitana]|uniref:bifunctional heptose 7-phosphate kinase/heptose 1-phosphate adenyltransferase n=1 Tax=Neorhodopirellula lusitana TaxID=445327 RepID=UPI00384B2F9E